MDAVPKGGAVRYIRQPDADPRALDALLGGVAHQARPEELEDAFMMMLRQPGRRRVRAAYGARPGGRHGAASASARNGGDGPVIVVRDLVRRFGDFTAVASTSFEVARGEIFGLLGPNGAGKTTTFRMLCGLLPATSGHLEVAGLNLRTARAQARGRIGYVSQKFALYGNLTVRENLEFFGGAYGLRGQARRQRVAAMVDQFGLDPGRSAACCPAATSSAWPWRPACCTSRRSCSWTNRPAASTRWRARVLARHHRAGAKRRHHRHHHALHGRGGILRPHRHPGRGPHAGPGHAAGGARPGRRRGAADMNNAFIAIVEQGRARAGGRHERVRIPAPLPGAAAQEVRQMLRDKATWPWACCCPPR